VLKEPELFEQFRRRIALTLFSEAEWLAARALLAGNGGDAVERAAALFVLCRQSHSGRMTNFSPVVKTRLRGGRNDAVNGWWGAVDGLEAIHQRLRNAQVLCGRALATIRATDAPSTFHYLDPPYPHSTRTAKKAYGAFEMNEADHRELLDLVRCLKGKVMISTYPSRLYDDALAGWTKETFDLANHASSSRKKDREVEVLFYNYRPGSAERKERP
jgi:DNA adenine methylase